MTRLELPPELVEKIRAAAQESTDPVELVDPEGIVLLAAPPTAGAATTREEIDEILARRDKPGPTYTHAEVMARLWSREAELEKGQG